MIGVIKKKEKIEELSAVHAKSFVTAQKVVLLTFYCTDTPTIIDSFLDMFDENES